MFVLGWKYYLRQLQISKSILLKNLYFVNFFYAFWFSFSSFNFNCIQQVPFTVINISAIPNSDLIFRVISHARSPRGDNLYNQFVIRVRLVILQMGLVISMFIGDNSIEMSSV